MRRIIPHTVPRWQEIAVSWDVVLYGRNFRNGADVLQMYQRARDRLAATNGVTAADAVSHLPLSGTALMDSFSRDFSREAGWDHAVANFYAVMPGYFGAMQIPILQGRDITDLENTTQQKVIVIDETLARMLRADGRLLPIAPGLRRPDRPATRRRCGSRCARRFRRSVPAVRRPGSRC